MKRIILKQTIKARMSKKGREKGKSREAKRWVANL
jgi:hypothetical protein